MPIPASGLRSRTREVLRNPSWQHRIQSELSGTASLGGGKKQRQHNEQLYKQRNRIERSFSRLKQFRHLATRYEKSKTCFKSLVALACSWLLLQLYDDTA